MARRISIPREEAPKLDIMETIRKGDDRLSMLAGQFEKIAQGFDNDVSPVEAVKLEEMLRVIEMKKKLKDVKQIHKYPVNYTEKSGWFTTVDDPLRPDGKRRIRKSTEEKLWSALVWWYFDRDDLSLSIKDIYPEWLEWKRTPRNASNIKRIEIEWSTYYENEPMSYELINKPMNKITVIELRKWAEKLLKKHYPVDRKKFSRMFSIMNNCFEYACDPDINVVRDNLWARAKKKVNKDLIVPIVTPSDESQVFTDDERRQIKKLVLEDMETYKDRPTSAGLQILFLLETGLRIGECCGLKWSDIRRGRLYIQRQADNNGVREWTKTTNGYRDIPLTDGALAILEKVREFNEEHGFDAEWIFQSSNPNYEFRLSYNAANNKLAKLCRRMDSIPKSAHKLRKTCLSALLDSPDVSNRTVQRYAGHSDITTTLRYYSFDRSSKEEQARAINAALALE